MRFRNRLLPPPPFPFTFSEADQKNYPPILFPPSTSGRGGDPEKNTGKPKKVSFLTLPSVPPFSSQSLIKPPKRNSNLTGGEGEEEEGSLGKEESSSAARGREEGFASCLKRKSSSLFFAHFTRCTTLKPYNGAARGFASPGA